MSHSLGPDGLQHARLPCPSPTPGSCTNSCPLSWWPSNHLALCLPLLLLPLSFPRIRAFSNKSGLHIRWPKYWSFNVSINLFNEYSGLIFFRIDRFDLLAVQGTHKSLLQHHSLKASILQHSFLFMVQLLHPYMITAKTLNFDSMDFCSQSDVSVTGVGNGNPFQYSCLENSMNRGAWWAIVHGVAKI